MRRVRSDELRVKVGEGLRRFAPSEELRVNSEKVGEGQCPSRNDG